MINEQPFDLAGFGMAAQFFLGVQPRSINRELEHSTFAGDERPRPDINFDTTFFQDFFRQTDGAGCVLSSRAVFKCDVKHA